MVVRYLVTIIGLSVLAVLIVDVFVDGNAVGKSVLIYIVSFLLGLGVFEFWWRRRRSK